MSEPIKLRLIHWTVPLPFGGVAVQSRLTYETGLEVDPERLYELHRSLGATGYCVRVRSEYLGQGLGPSTGIVDRIKDGVVRVRAHEGPDIFSGSPDDFFRIYEVD